MKSVSDEIDINNCRRSGEALKNTGGPGGKVGSNGDCGGAIGGGKVKGRWSKHGEASSGGIESDVASKAPSQGEETHESKECLHPKLP